MTRKCNQINIPEVDNSSPCDDFVYSECVIVNRKSKILKDIENEDLNNYQLKLENYIKVLELRLRKAEAFIKYINTNLPDIGIGVYEE